MTPRPGCLLNTPTTLKKPEAKGKEEELFLKRKRAEGFFTNGHYWTACK